MGMIDEGVPEVCLFQSNGIKTFHQLSRSAHVPNYKCIGPWRLYTLSCELIEHLSYTDDFWICVFDNACHSWTEMFLCHSIEISIYLERLF